MSQPEETVISPDSIVPVEAEPTGIDYSTVHLRLRPEWTQKLDRIVAHLRADPDRIVETVGRTEACRYAIGQCLKLMDSEASKVMKGNV